MKPSLQVRLSQHLALTPQLQQSIRLLQLSTLELHQEVEQMLEQNPFLEADEEGPSGDAAAPGSSSAASDEGWDGGSAGTTAEAAGEQHADGGDGDSLPAADAADSAREASPRLAIGKPSKTVAAEPAPPGTPKRMAGMGSPVAVVAPRPSRRAMAA